MNASDTTAADASTGPSTGTGMMTNLASPSSYAWNATLEPSGDQSGKSFVVRHRVELDEGIGLASGIGAGGIPGHVDPHAIAVLRISHVIQRVVCESLSGR